MGNVPTPKENMPHQDLVDIDEIQFAEVNPKLHDLQSLADSEQRYGFVELPVVNESTGRLVAGQGRIEALRALKQAGKEPPEGVVAREDRWLVDARFFPFKTDLEAQAYLVDSNNLGLLGGDFTPFDLQRLWDEDAYQAALQSLAAESALPISVDGDSLDSLLAAQDAAGALVGQDEIKDARHRKPRPSSAVDLIYTAGTYSKDAIEEPRFCLVHCCMAVRVGFMYGVQSTGSGGVCRNHQSITGHKVEFIDNEFKDYNHGKHLAAVEMYRPKYCTVRDIMTREQCREAGIEYYPIEQILDWAEELGQYATNVIVIPKFDCFDRIPEKYILGYSIPTSYGGTPLAPEMFRGRRVHLLGGSPDRQLDYWHELGKDVVSLDNNYLLKMANYGSVWTPQGTKTLTELGIEECNGVAYVAVTISQGCFAAQFRANSETGIDGTVGARE